MVIRFGIDSALTRRLYKDTDEWLIVRRVYETGVIHEMMGGNTGRIRSRLRLERAIRAACQGIWSRGGKSYIEVRPWQEDGQYPTPMPVMEFLDEASKNHQQGQLMVIQGLHRSRR